MQYNAYILKLIMKTSLNRKSNVRQSEIEL